MRVRVCGYKSVQVWECESVREGEELETRDTVGERDRESIRGGGAGHDHHQP